MSELEDVKAERDRWSARVKELESRLDSIHEMTLGDLVLSRDVIEVLREKQRAQRLYPRFNSAHEGYAIALEEFDELWQEVMVKHTEASRPFRMRREAMQAAAMLLRFIEECT